METTFKSVHRVQEVNVIYVAPANNFAPLKVFYLIVEYQREHL